MTDATGAIIEETIRFRAYRRASAHRGDRSAPAGRLVRWM